MLQSCSREVHMEKQAFIDRMLETENLTDNLDDDAADDLLKWGISQLDFILADAEHDQAARERVQALMQAMRSVNRIVGGLPAAAPAQVDELDAHYARAFGKSTSATSPAQAAVAAEVSGLQGREAVKFLLDWVQRK
jgi:hypothetical protein